MKRMAMKRTAMAALAAGCILAGLEGVNGQMAATEPATQASTQAARQPMLTGPMDYNGWKNGAVGSWTRYVGTSTAAGKTTKRDETLRLVAVTPAMVTFERKLVATDAEGKVSTQTSKDGRGPMSGPMASGKLEPGTELTEGNEDVKVGERTLHCHWQKLVTTRGKDSRTYQVWSSPEVPGLWVKETSVMSRAKPDGTTEQMTGEAVLVEFGMK